MAKRRMFSLDVVDTDKFLELPVTAQCLYFHLGMRADDDGIVSSPKRITNMVNCSMDDLKLLAYEGLLIAFESGIVAITDWKVSNCIQKDRYTESQYLDEKALLATKENGQYTMQNIMDTKCIQDVSKMDTQVRLGEVSKVKENIYSSAELEQQIWSLYPRKTGKQQAIKWIHNLLKEHGYDELEKAINRYKRYVEGQRKTFPDLEYQNGKTFFYGGYLDYMDENYVEEKPKSKEKAKPQIAAYQIIGEGCCSTCRGDGVVRGEGIKWVTCPDCGGNK
jgi:hypothetical protein